MVLVFAFPLYSHLLTALPRKPRGTLWGRHLSAVFEDANANFEQMLLTLTFLAHRSYLMLDAIVRTLVRKHITHRLLLQWVTASESQRTLGNAPLDFLKRMWQAPALAMWSRWLCWHGGPNPPRRRALPDRLGALACL